MHNNHDMLNENKNVEPYTRDTPIVLKSLACKATFNSENNTISIVVPNNDEFVCSSSAFKWVEGYPKSIGQSHKRCETALNCLKTDDLVGALQQIYKLPYAPFFVYLFEKDRPMLKSFSYIIDKINEKDKERIELFLKSIIEESEDVSKLKKSDPETYKFLKELLENLILYLKSKCEVFYWFYQGLPQLSQFGIW